MKDQVDNLARKTGAPIGAALYGMLTAPERGAVFRGLHMGDIGILYIAPEQLRNKRFIESIIHREISCWVFDEAHCLSKWGHDFRPDYLYAARFIKEFAKSQKKPLPAIQCFTATAKLEVRNEIIDFFIREIGIQLREMCEGGVERKNLTFEVRPSTPLEKFPLIHDLLADSISKEIGGAAVVYFATRAGSEKAAAYLQQSGWDADVFHAGLDPGRKREVQENFMLGKTRVVCSTNAFGMGIDKEDVRIVIHADIPGSLENYLQEAGRAGRDQKTATCVLLYDERDIENQFRLSAYSELTRRDIAQILRGLEKAKKSKNGEVVITSGELLRSTHVDTSFESSDMMADTKVRTALAWLERSRFLERNSNLTRVFQGKPLVSGMEE
ncbi:MAG: helicase-related protein, partial [Nitrospinota bacterium]